jgi:hypothetical protein
MFCVLAENHLQFAHPNSVEFEVFHSHDFLAVNLKSISEKDNPFFVD